MSAGAVAAANTAAAAAHQAKLREEEERLTTYTNNDLEGWEFKIVRSAGKINREKFRQLCAEESQNGWELVEKFDESRVRFKRRIEHRDRDGYGDIDPYRTQFGLSEGKLVLLILAGVFGALALVVTLVMVLAG